MADKLTWKIKSYLSEKKDCPGAFLSQGNLIPGKQNFLFFTDNHNLFFTIIFHFSKMEFEVDRS